MYNSGMNIIIVIVSMIATFIIIAVIAVIVSAPNSPFVTDPRVGTVLVTDNGTATTTKVCDGTNLIYISRTMQGASNSAIANSAECATDPVDMR